MVGVLGINYESSSLEIREKFSFNEEKYKAFGDLLRQREGFSGAIILSTCNRSEIYFQMNDCCQTSAFSHMLKSLKQFVGVTENVRQHFYFKIGEDCFAHLFQVVSGVQSMVFGEYQIVGQIKQALQESENLGLSDTVLSRLFTKALETSKQIRNATKINEGAFSVSSAGIEKSIEVFPDIEKRKVLILGAGETGQLTLKSLLKKNCSNITIANRTNEKAEKLAKAHGVKSVIFDDLEKTLSHIDIVYVSTSSQEPLITHKMVQGAMEARDFLPQLYIDLSVPRNVDVHVNEINNANVVDVDHLQEVVDHHDVKRKQRTCEVNKMIDQHVEEYVNWLSTRNLNTIIQNIKTGFETINKSELQTFKKINKADDVLLDDYGIHISKKYSRMFIKKLREVTDNGRKAEYVKVLNDLFAME
ncbi:glutamyl-tRNA reductase [Bacteroidales bacterium]|nr:glutamyl-tRNA reductase [Bacteroidales bacterium]